MQKINPELYMYPRHSTIILPDFKKVNNKYQNSSGKNIYFQNIELT